MKVKKYYINEVEAREKDLNVLSENVENENKDDVIVYDGFTEKTKEEIAEIITHVAFYVGWPKAWSAFNIAKEIYKD